MAFVFVNKYVFSYNPSAQILLQKGMICKPYSLGITSFSLDIKLFPLLAMPLGFSASLLPLFPLSQKEEKAETKKESISLKPLPINHIANFLYGSNAAILGRYTVPLWRGLLEDDKKDSFHFSSFPHFALEQKRKQKRKQYRLSPYWLTI